MSHIHTPETPPQERPGLPMLPKGVPTLARHLDWALRFITERCQCQLTHADTLHLGNAVAALEALPKVPSATRRIGDTDYMTDEAGRLEPISLVKAPKLLEDDLVRRIAQGAISVNHSLGRFKTMSFWEAQSLLDTLAAEHNVTPSSRRGDIYLYSYDRKWKVSVTSQENITFGPTIEVAKQLLIEWLDDEQASPELKSTITDAFQINDQKRLRVGEILRLRGRNNPHPKWQAAMRVISEAMETIGSREYLRVYRRDAGGTYRLLALDLSSVERAAV